MARKVVPRVRVRSSLHQVRSRVEAPKRGHPITWRRLLSATGNHAATSLRVEVAAFLFAWCVWLTIAVKKRHAIESCIRQRAGVHCATTSYRCNPYANGVSSETK